MFTLLELSIVGAYLAVLAVLMALIQIYKPGEQKQKQSSEAFVEDTLDVSDSEEETAQFNPETEQFQITENPMFSHQESNDEEPPTELRRRTVSALIDEIY
jgi:hypothetical protein